MTKKQIPNILSVIRLLMVPLFVVLFFSESKYSNYCALSVFILAELTDVLDGYLARRNNWITDLGKILDPLADKLMQLAAFICLAIKNNDLIFLAVLVTVKELCFVICGLVIRRKKNYVVVSKWYGKMATFIIALCVCIMIIWGDIPAVAYSCAAACAASMIFAFVMYIIYYYNNIFRKSKG